MLTGLSAPSVDEEIDGLLLRAPRPTQADIIDFLKLYTEGEPRNIAARTLIIRGISPVIVSGALSHLQTVGVFNHKNVMKALVLASALASGFHGFKRNSGSIGWGLWWFVMGSIFPIVTPALGFAQGFAKKKAS